MMQWQTLGDAAGFGHMSGAGWVMMIVWTAVAIMFVVVATQALRGTKSHGTTETKSPLDVLAERFARGEIDETEYVARRDVLKA
jgi:putative membrane protein